LPGNKDKKSIEGSLLDFFANIGEGTSGCFPCKLREESKYLLSSRMNGCFFL
jgi:hypothetical protein